MKAPRSSYESPWLTDDLLAFRSTVRQFVRTQLVPQLPRWRAQHHPDMDAYAQAGALGLLLPDTGSAYGGGGGTFAHEVIVLEELARAGVVFGSSVQSIVAHYIAKYGNEDQKQAWLPRMAAGEMVAAIAMTEPDAGSDLQGIKTTARRDGSHYVLDGTKTFITNGLNAGLVCVAVKTEPKATGPRALSLICVETKDLPGYRVGRPLEKVGRNGHDTCELFFDGVRVPASNLLGSAEGQGFSQMMDQLTYERLSVAVSAVATAEEAVAITTRYAKDRTISGQPLLDYQNTRMVLATCKTEAHIGRVFVDNCVTRFMADQLDSATAAMAKYWLTETEGRIVDACLQLHGGYGYMSEYAISQMWADSRVERIFAGSNEVMKELIAWSL